MGSTTKANIQLDQYVIIHGRYVAFVVSSSEVILLVDKVRSNGRRTMPEKPKPNDVIVSIRTATDVPGLAKC
jgi:hypothetical protein